MVIHEKLRELNSSEISYTTDSLAAYFNLPRVHFSQVAPPSGPIVFHQAGLQNHVAAALSGCIFWPDNRKIAPGIPELLLSSDHTDNPLAAHNDSSLIEAASISEAVIENHEPGIEVRLYEHGGQYFFATRSTYNGRDGLFGTGIESPRKLGITVSSEAMKICRRDYASALKLASIGYTVVFSLLIPERDDYAPADRPGLIFTDAIDPDYEFVDRLEKERIAEDYGLAVCPLEGRLINIESPATYFGRLRALEIGAAQSGGAGFVVKAKNEFGERLAVKAEPDGSRGWNQQFSETELNEALETIKEEFPKKNQPPEFLEELMLEYLGSTRRSVRWQVSRWLGSQEH